MFEISTIKTALSGAIGFKNTADPDLPDCTLTLTDTGMYYNDYHPLITFDNLYYIAPNYDAMDFSAYAATSSYATGAYVIYSGIAYEATRTIAAGTAPTATAWKSPVNTWIQQKVNATVSKLCNQIATNKKNNESTKSFLENIQVITGPGDVSDVVTPASRFVGFEIEPKYINNISAIIDYIGLQFTEIQSDLKIYLFHSSQQTAIGVFTITTTGAKNFIWKNAASVVSGRYSMPYVDFTNNISPGGKYFIGYFEDDITGNAIYTDWNSCQSSVNYKLLNNYITIRPIEVTTLNGTSLFDLDDIGYSTHNHGLNLSISVKVDITEMIVSNKTLFTNALGYQFAWDMLWEMIHNPNSRINRTHENAQRGAVQYELGDGGTLKKNLEDAVKALQFDFSNISQAVPKDGPRRMKVKAI